MASKSGKRKLVETSSQQDAAPDEVKLFVDAPPDDSDGSDHESGDETDSSQSEESNFSGLDEEEDDEEEAESSEVESIEGGDSSEEEDEEDDDSDADSGDADASSEDEEANSEDTKEEQVTNGNILKEKAEKALNKLNNKKTKQLDRKNKNGNSQQLQKPEPTTQKIEARKKPKKPKKKAQTAVEGTTSAATITPGTSTGIQDEYEFDSSDEEDIRNTVGNIPMEWYREFEHIGYDVEGKKIIKPKGGDQIDEFIDKMENPDYWRTVTDKTTGQKVILSDQDVELIQRLRRGRYVDSSYNPYEPWVDFFTHEVMKHPVTNRPEHKRSFIPSKWERQKVSRLVHAMKMGWIKPKKKKVPTATLR